MPAPPSPEVVKFLDVMNGFMENPPRDLPDGALDTIKELRNTLKGYGDSGELSPGEREAKEKMAPGTEGTGTSFGDAAKGADGPSPGQQEFSKLEQRIAQLESGSQVTNGN